MEERKRWEAEALAARCKPAESTDQRPAQVHMARDSPAASSRLLADPPPLPSQWDPSKPQDFAAHRAAPCGVGCGGSFMLAPVARLAGAHEPHGAGFAAALPRGARCGGGGGSSLEDAFAGGSRRSSLGDSFASSGGTDAPRTRSTTTTAAGSRCSPNPFASPALGSPFDAAFEGGFERRRSDFDFDAAFSCAPSWFNVSRMSFSNDGASPYPQPWPKRCYGLGPPVRVSELR